MMCIQCDNSELTYADYLDAVIAPLVRRNGWAVQGVGGRQPFAYTVGLSDCGLPELVVTGLPDAPAARLLNEVAGRGLHDELRSGQRVPTWGPHEHVHVLAVARPHDHLHTATALYGKAVRALQLVWPDDRGRYPWQAGAQAQPSGQRLLGPIPAVGPDP